MTMQDEYKIRLEVFEGPLDLLLYLIRKNEVDIHDIPIETITTQYMEYMDLMRMLDLNIAGEFIVMAATLMMIKSRMLLPAEERTHEEDDEEDDPRWDLVRQLVEYKKFKDVAIHLQDLEVHQENIFTREGESLELGAPSDVALHDVGIFDLITAFNNALSRVKKEELREIFSERFTVGEKVDQILGMLRDRDEFSLTEVIGSMKSRHEVVCMFLAVLELMRLKQIKARQQGAFGDIVLQRVEEI